MVCRPVGVRGICFALFLPMVDGTQSVIGDKILLEVEETSARQRLAYCSRLSYHPGHTLQGDDRLRNYRSFHFKRTVTESLVK